MLGIKVFATRYDEIKSPFGSYFVVIHYESINNDDGMKTKVFNSGAFRLAYARRSAPISHKSFSRTKKEADIFTCIEKDIKDRHDGLMEYVYDDV